MAFAELKFLGIMEVAGISTSNASFMADMIWRMSKDARIPSSMRVSQFSKNYIKDRKSEMYSMLAAAETQEEKNALIDAYYCTIFPARR